MNFMFYAHTVHTANIPITMWLKVSGLSSVLGEVTKDVCVQFWRCFVVGLPALQPIRSTRAVGAEKTSKGLEALWVLTVNDHHTGPAIRRQINFTLGDSRLIEFWGSKSKSIQSSPHTDALFSTVSHRNPSEHSSPMHLLISECWVPTILSVPGHSGPCQPYQPPSLCIKWLCT